MYTRTLLNKNHSADTKHRVRTADRALAFGDEPVRRTKWFQQHQHALCKIDLSSVAREVKEDENGDNFAVAHLKSAISALFPSLPIAFQFAYRIRRPNKRFPLSLQCNQCLYWTITI